MEFFLAGAFFGGTLVLAFCMRREPPWGESEALDGPQEDPEGTTQQST